MIKLKKEEIPKLQPITNKVLIKPNRKIDEIYLTDGYKLYFDPQFEPNKHAPVTGEVIQVPLRLSHPDKTFGFKSEIEILPGDIAYFSFLASVDHLNPITENNIVDEDRNFYFWIDYQEIYCVTRRFKTAEIDEPTRQYAAKNNGIQVFSAEYDAVVAINHYHLIEPVDLTLSTNIELPEHIRRKESDILGKVLGAPAKPVQYLTEHLSSGTVAKAGDYVLFPRGANANLEFDIHRSLFGRNKKIAVITQRDIMGIVEPHLMESNSIK